MEVLSGVGKHNRRTSAKSKVNSTARPPPPENKTWSESEPLEPEFDRMFQRWNSRGPLLIKRSTAVQVPMR